MIKKTVHRASDLGIPADDAPGDEENDGNINDLGNPSGEQVQEFGGLPLEIFGGARSFLIEPSRLLADLEGALEKFGKRASALEGGGKAFAGLDAGHGGGDRVAVGGIAAGGSGGFQSGERTAARAEMQGKDLGEAPGGEITQVCPKKRNGRHQTGGGRALAQGALRSPEECPSGKSRGIDGAKKERDLAKIGGGAFDDRDRRGQDEGGEVQNENRIGQRAAEMRPCPGQPAVIFGQLPEILGQGAGLLRGFDDGDVGRWKARLAKSSRRGTGAAKAGEQGAPAARQHGRTAVSEHFEGAGQRDRAAAQLGKLVEELLGLAKGELHFDGAWENLAGMGKLTQRAADEKFLRAALAQARKGLGRTHPNPAVGAVIVRNGRILSRGWHRAAGRPHAEIEALRALESPALARGATLYVTLEPCSTRGRTPPCTRAIIQAGFARVVYGATDPNPRHAGRAKALLTRAGLAVTTGVLAEECTALNPEWNKWIATGLPYVIAKAGMTLDGRISSPPGERWITSAASRRDAMRLRARAQAVLVGGETVRTDDPQLTVRGLPVREQPWRAVWTKSGRLPKDACIFRDVHRARTLVFAGRSLRAALRELARRDAACVLIEGGGRTLGEAFDRGLVDEVCFYLAPRITGGPVPAVGGRGASGNESAIRLKNLRYRKIGNDLRLQAEVDRAR